MENGRLIFADILSMMEGGKFEKEKRSRKGKSTETQRKSFFSGLDSYEVMHSSGSRSGGRREFSFWT
jgi:hypothetical protein